MHESSEKFRSIHSIAASAKMKILSIGQRDCRGCGEIDRLTRLHPMHGIK
jgi:hypothetical protein